MLEKLKKSVLQANLDLVKHNLVVFTWGNVSGLDKDKNLVVIKPSGVKYEDLTLEKMVVVDMQGNVVEGDLKPSSDTSTHLVLYQNFPGIGGIVHTHSEWAVSWAQAGRDIPCYGTTQADYFFGSIPCTRKLSKEEVARDYEKNTGLVIVEKFRELDPVALPGTLVYSHGPFSWGKDADEAVHNAVVMEETAKMAFRTEVLGNKTAVDQYLLDKHYYRKHGENAYYGQK
jgi:L-ribulose-5-phosphate 4-epimerase